MVGQCSPSTRRDAAQIVVDLVDYAPLFTADRPSADLRTWADASTPAIAEKPSGRTINKGTPLTGETLQPMLAAGTYLATTCGPHAVQLSHQLHRIDKTRLRDAPQHSADPGDHLAAGAVRASRCATAVLPEHHIRARLDTGWSPEDSLTPISLNHLARQAELTQYHSHWTPRLRRRIEATLTSRNREAVRAGRPRRRHRHRRDAVPWPLPLHQPLASGLVGIVRTAAIVLIAAVSGMRASELMELKIDAAAHPSSRPRPGPLPAGQHYRQGPAAGRHTR